MGKHSVILDLESAVLRQAIDRVEAEGYGSLEELFEALVVNSEQHPSAAEPELRRPSDEKEHWRDRLEDPDGPLAALLETPNDPRGRLSFLTNRLNPVKVSVRVLANMAEHDTWPASKDYGTEASRIARILGQRLRFSDEEAKRRGSARRWIGYPVGKDEKAGLQRFTFSFTDEGSGGGPLRILGLTRAIGVDGIGLTEAGWALAQAPMPLLDDTSETLSDEDIAIFRERLLAAPDERAAIAEFLRAVHQANGAQGRLDELLNTWHGDWTDDTTTAHRAAMLGRLSEVGVLSVEGRGPSAQITLWNTSGFEENGNG